MKLCPTCQNKYPDDANFCPREECAGARGPQRLVAMVEPPPVRFVQVSRIGGGPSGEVWQASDAQSGAAVAYKIVAAEVLPTPVTFERAQRELRQLQRAGNPKIVKVIDFGKTPDGRLFVASELASGEPLDQLISRSGPMSLERAKRVAAQIGEALLEAQKVGVVHRDLAAKNILVSGDDDVRVINFAIPRPLSETLFGVAEYMSPEQAEGKLIDQRSNTYSLGALLYLMLTGQPPHSGATPQATIEATLKGEITPPSIKRGSGLTAEVDRIVLKALERNSSRRPLTMRQFLTDVSGLIVTEEQAGPTAAPATGRDLGFARTMMFAGGVSEVQKLVAQATAARQAAGGNGAAEPVAPAAQTVAFGLAGTAPKPGTPPPATASGGTPTSNASIAAPSEMSSGGGTPGPARASHGAAVAATMIAMPAAPGASGFARVETTPAAPSGGTRTPPLHPTKPTGSGDAAAGFRETLWFKKGDVDQMVADARAKVAAMANAKKAAAAELELPVDDAKPLEDRYVDDGTVTVEDRAKFSLGSGGTSTATPRRARAISGERMSDDEMISEIGGGKRVVIIGIVVAVVVALVAVVALSMKGKDKGKAALTKVPEATVPVAEKPPAAVAAPVANPPPMEAPGAAAPPAEKAGTAGGATATAAATDEKEEKTEPSVKPPAAHKKVVAKKKPALVKKHK